MSDRSRFIALLLSLFGFLGLHRFYLGRVRTGLLMLITVGGFGIWWLFDVFLLLTGRLTDGNKLQLAWFGGKSQPEAATRAASSSERNTSWERNHTAEVITSNPDDEAARAAGKGEVFKPNGDSVGGIQQENNSAETKGLGLDDLRLSAAVRQFCNEHKLVPDEDRGILISSGAILFPCESLIEHGLGCDVEDLDDILADPDDDWNMEMINEIHEIILKNIIGDGEEYDSSIDDEENDGEWYLNFGNIEKLGENIRYTEFFLEPSGFDFLEILNR